MYIATTYGCPVCKETEDPQFIKDEGLPELIPGGYVSSSLVSHIMYEKYADALPLYRQEKGFELLGVSISRTTMAGWIITCAPDYLQPVYYYTETRAGGNAASFLDGIDEDTYVMADGYSGYNKLKKIRWCCCTHPEISDRSHSERP